MTFEMARTCTLCLAILATAGVAMVFIYGIMSLHTLSHHSEMRRLAERTMEQTRRDS